MSIRLPVFVVSLLGLALGVATAVPAAAQPAYSLLIKGGHVIDPKNGRDGVMDVAVANGRSPRSPPRSTPPRRVASSTPPASTSCPG